MRLFGICVGVCTYVDVRPVCVCTCGVISVSAHVPVCVYISVCTSGRSVYVSVVYTSVCARVYVLCTSMYVSMYL